jgi:hypothetical protein
VRRRKRLRDLPGKQECGGGKRKRGCRDHDAARSGQRRLDRDHHEPYGGERRDPAGGSADHRDEDRKGCRPHDLRALVVSGA